MKEFTKKNSLTRQMLFRNVCSNSLQIKEIFDEVAVGSQFVLFGVLSYNTYISLGIAWSDCFPKFVSSLLSVVNIEKIKIRIT